MVLSAALLDQCAPQVSPVLMQALVRTESAGQPFAIGMDKAHGTVKQPATAEEAVATAKSLVAAGRKFSVGLAQIHVSNVSLYGLTWEQAFDACQNLQVGQKILWNFYHRASASGYSGMAAIWAALRGYNSGGVDRTISDDYASRIFAYMSSAPPQVQFGTAAAPARAAASTPRAALNVATLPAAGQGAPHRPGESLDIFEKAASKTGF
ncbi:lytic transglycosylase [Variovorax sp. WS11]|uniref:lytic transglycosylase domain-containing protein n=1 Tax=Variovorax sp. WS11 TaxID=1105204 RepID=UPI000D0D6B18|nr:lytic transglycosylase domain-containing protein [Variovorax sp. WS11]NDZ17134.1 lytic transglycosylase domain-containing protein [Variovorax sp. WS11]PSL81255.1 lytic transglycosylase [Variovorax sp. WS11]